MKKDNLVGLVLGAFIIGSVTLSPKHVTSPVFTINYDRKIELVEENKPKINPLLTSNKPTINLLNFTDYETPFSSREYKMISGACPPHIFGDSFLNGDWKVSNTAFFIEYK